MYTAIVLAPDSRETLLKAVRDNLGNIEQTHPEIIAHHCTLKMGPKAANRF